ncbi:uncharacterized protein [Littorina saxatilis]|uniref:uncharacterized protein n=1 Tax=Littorina saxatilis TaxID=31220 RepID=UPI0038B4F060
MSTKQQPDTGGKLERSVKMDYSETYRENDRLDLDLDEQIISLTRNAQRALTGKDDELVAVKADADRTRKLKEAVNHQQNRETDSLGILCQSPPKLSRSASLAPPRKLSAGNGSGRRASVGNTSSRRDNEGNVSSRSDNEGNVSSRSSNGVGNVSARRLSVVNLVSSRRASIFSCSGTLGENSGDGEREENGGGAAESYRVLESGEVADTRKKSITERRLAMERDRFSSKNLFNVKRRHSAVTNTAERDNSPEGLRKNMSAMNLSKQQGQGQVRPKTSPAAHGYRRGLRSKSSRDYLRPTTSSASRLVRFADNNADDGDSYLYAAARRPRSRRELEKLSALRMDHFVDGDSMATLDRRATEAWGSNGGSGGDPNQDLLQRLRGGRPGLQARVTTFLKDMDEFNKRSQKSALEQILEAT